MTCIVAVRKNGVVYMAGDSAGVDERYNIVLRKDAKVFRNGHFVMGFTDSFRMGQLLQFKFTPPVPHIDQDIMTFMVTDFVESVRTCLKDGGYASKKDEVEEGGNFLVGYKDRLFNIEGDYQVGEAFRDYDSVGCGSYYALGAMAATYTDKIDPKKFLTSALDAAVEFSCGVKGPYVYAQSDK